MKVLVTGGLGFIGSHLVRRLQSDGHMVRVLDDGSHAVLPLKHPRSSEDVSDSNVVFRAVTGLQPDLIFHLAAVSRTVPAIENPCRCHQVNATGTLAVLRSAILSCPQARIVIASSNVTLGEWTPYKVSKLAAEGYAQTYSQLYGMSVIALRFSNVYGPRMRWDDEACFASLRRSKHEKGYIEITGDGEQRRDWTHVSDIVRACIIAGESKYCGVLDICTGREVSMNEVAKLFDCQVRHREPRKGDSFTLSQSPFYADLFLNWRASIALEDGIKDVLAEVPVHA